MQTVATRDVFCLHVLHVLCQAFNPPSLSACLHHGQEVSYYDLDHDGSCHGVQLGRFCRDHCSLPTGPGLQQCHAIEHLQLRPEHHYRHCHSSLALRQVWQLQANLKQKIILLVVFATGSL